jgi:hypothetical protein
MQKPDAATSAHLHGKDTERQQAAPSHVKRVAARYMDKSNLLVTWQNPLAIQILHINMFMGDTTTDNQHLHGSGNYAYRLIHVI